MGLVWLRSSFGKITGGKFVDSLGNTLTKFTSGNPNIWYNDFTKSIVIPNSKIFGNLIMWGEFFSAVVIILGSLYLIFGKRENRTIELLFVIGLLGGGFLNLNFWLASGWTSPSTDSLNLLMLAIEVIAIFIFAKKLLKK